MWSLVPVDVVLAWPSPNYVNPETQGPAVWWISAIFLAAATFSVAARLWTRLFVRRWFGLDDGLVVLGYVFSVAVTALVAIGHSRYNWDRHIWDVRSSMYAPSAKVLYFSRIAWGLAASFTRLSVLCLYYRLLAACEAPRRFFWVTHATTGATVVMLFYYLFTGIFACTPIRQYWAWPSVPDGKCFNDGLSFQVSAVVNTFLEVVVATLPLVGIFLLRVDRKQRWAVAGVLSLGYSVAIAGAFRSFYIWKIVETHDLSWYATPQWICSEVENDLALICACAAPLRPVLTRLVRNFRGLPGQLAHVPRPKRSWLSTNQTNASNQGTYHVKDIQTASDWITTMSRTIDLEGIANDGFGYSVHISGPSKAERRRMARQQLKENLDKTGLTTSKDRARSSKSQSAFAIATKTDFSVVETENEKGLGSGPGWGYVSGTGLGGTYDGPTKPTYTEDEDAADPWITSIPLEDLPSQAIGHAAHTPNDSSENINALPPMPTRDLDASRGRQPRASGPKLPRSRWAKG